MRIRKTIDKPIRYQRDGINVVGGINAHVSANVSEGGSVSGTSVRSRNRIVQRNGRTEIDRETTTLEDHEEVDQ